MNSVDLVAMRNDQYHNNTIDESSDFLKDLKTIQNYVTDYIQHRVHLYKDYSPHLPKIDIPVDYRFELIRAVASIFEKEHANELTDMATTLCSSGRLTFQRYVEVVECFAENDDVESNEQLSYGRLVALIAFAGLVAVKLCDIQLFSEVQMIASYTSKFLHKRIVLTWPQERRSWECFFDRAKMIIDRNEREGSEQHNLKSECSRWWLSIRALVIFGMFGIGAFTLMKTVLKAR